jgi:hypothetical protein
MVNINKSGRIYTISFKTESFLIFTCISAS